jgi:hypothetical protein
MDFSSAIGFLFQNVLPAHLLNWEIILRITPAHRSPLPRKALLARANAASLPTAEARTHHKTIYLLGRLVHAPASGVVRKMLHHPPNELRDQTPIFVSNQTIEQVL